MTAERTSYAGNRYNEPDKERHYSVKHLAEQFTQFGLMAGFYPAIEEFEKFGHNGAVGTSYETIWTGGGIYVYPPDPIIMKISSGNINDTSAGTGAQTVKIVGLDENWHFAEEVVSLNGQTAVNTLRKYIRINRMRVITAGAGLGNAGILYAGVGAITTGVPATTYACIEVGANQTLQALYSIAAQHTGYLMHYEFCSAIAKAVTCGVFVRPPGEVFSVRDYRLFISGTTEDSSFDVLEPKTDIELRALTAGGGGDISGSMVFILERMRG